MLDPSGLVVSLLLSLWKCGSCITILVATTVHLGTARLLDRGEPSAVMGMFCVVV